MDHNRPPALIEKGRAYEDFIEGKFRDVGIDIGMYRTKAAQYNIGENKLGLEIKFDDIHAKSGNLYIEIDELGRDDKYHDSGIYRQDNTKLYLIGDYDDAWVFDKHLLRQEHKSGKWRQVVSRWPGDDAMTMPARGHGFLLPKTSVNDILYSRLNFKGDRNDQEREYCRIGEVLGGDRRDAKVRRADGIEDTPEKHHEDVQGVQAVGQQRSAIGEGEKVGARRGESAYQGETKRTGGEKMNVDFDEVKASTVGKWDSILAHAGIDVGDGRAKGCPSCGGEDRFRYDDKDGRGTYFCNGCGAGDGYRMLGLINGWDVKEKEGWKSVMEYLAPIVGAMPQGAVKKKEPTITREKFGEILKGSKEIEYGTPVWTYLNNRGLRLSEPGHYPDKLELRYHPAMYESETKKEHPAMLAIFRSLDRTGITIHRTYLTDDGHKLDIKSPKKIMPGLDKMSGGAVQLFPIVNEPGASLNGFLGITEGIETALAVAQAQETPVWACLSTSLMKKFIPPEGLKTLIVWADNDKNFAGHEAAYSLVHRLKAERPELKLDVLFPKHAGTDFFDEVVGLNGRPDNGV